MDKFRFIIFFISAWGLLSSCELGNLDNYDGPTAGLSGAFIDEETGELVQQDIIRGTEIELREHGYDPVAPQYLRVKNDGTYEHSMLFANTYTVQPVRGNFVAIGPQEVDIKKGGTELDFIVTPYIRVIDVVIEKNGDHVNATFRLQQNVLNEVNRIGLYAHPEPNVGEPMRILAEEQNINSVVDENQTFNLSLDISGLDTGKPYFFRVGALIDVSEAKFNYAPAVRIDT